MEIGVGGMNNAPTYPELQSACSASGLGSFLLEPQVKCTVLFCLVPSSSAVFWGKFLLQSQAHENLFTHSSQEETIIDLIEGSVQIKQIEHSGTGIFLLWRQVAEAE